VRLDPPTLRLPESRDSHSSAYGDGHRLRTCDAVHCGRISPTFQNSMLPLSLRKISTLPTNVEELPEMSLFFYETSQSHIPETVVFVLILFGDD